MRIGRIAVALAGAIGLFLGGPLAAFGVGPDHSAGGDVSDFRFSSFDADYHLSRDPVGHSRLTTVETFVAEFPDFDQNRGIIRAIPNGYDGVPLDTRIESVVDETGAAVPYESVDTGEFTELALGTDEFVRGSQTYRITYTQQNVVRSFDDTGADEFYWDTNGTGFGQVFDRVTARVHVDADVAQFLNGDAACYYGAYGETRLCGITSIRDADDPDTPTQVEAARSASAEPGPEAVVFEASATALQPGENLSVAIGFEQATFVQVTAVPESARPDRGGPLERASAPGWLAVVSVAAIVIGVFGAITQVVRRLTWSRDARGRGIIIPEYSVPRGFSPTVAADLINRGGTALSAQIVSLAVRGNLRILDYPVSASGADFTLQLSHSEHVETEELELLTVLFGSGLSSGATRELDRTLTGLSRLSAFPAKARKIAVARGWRAKAVDRVGPRVITIQFITLFCSAAALIGYGVLSASPAQAWTVFAWTFPMMFLGILSMAISIMVQTEKWPLTEAGAERRDYLRGMRMYLQLAEKERFRVLQSPTGADRVAVSAPADFDGHGPGPGAVDEPDPVQMVALYEKLLPFAVLWGVEREWTEELGRYYDRGAPAPDWFVSSGSFDSRVFSHAIAGVAATSRAASRPPVSMSSWTGSSGGSFSGGSSGGGFSGGGGGGGGGGGR